MNIFCGTKFNCVPLMVIDGSCDHLFVYTSLDFVVLKLDICLNAYFYVFHIFKGVLQMRLIKQSKVQLRM